MATIGTAAVTLMDIARRLDPNDKIQRVVELMAQRLEVLVDIPWMEGNLFTGHKTTIRTGLPSVVFRQFNQGLQPAKSTTAQIVDACAMMEARSSIDKALADLNGNTAEFRLSEDMAFIEALDQKFSTTLFCGDTRQNPDQFFGFSPRFSTMSTNNTKSGYNIIDAGGAGATNTSIWCVGWGENTAFGIYPKGTKAVSNMRIWASRCFWIPNPLRAAIRGMSRSSVGTAVCACATGAMSPASPISTFLRSWPTRARRRT